MPAARLSMRRTREILRLRWGEALSLREVARGAGVGATTVRDVIGRAKQAGLGWPLHPTYAEMARYYGTAIIPARVRKPRDKAKVENGVQQVERWVLAPLRDQKFFSRSEANRALRERLDWLNDRPLSRLDGTRRSLWEEIDRPALRPLPLLRFEVPEWKVSVGVGIDYHVDFHGHYYSVPHALRANKGRVDVRATDTIVEIFHKRRRVASHRCSRRRGGYTTDRSHMPKSHQKYAEWTPSRIIRWAETIGPETTAMAREVMEHRPHPEQGFRSCLGIIRLAKQYETERLERACKRARAIGALSYRSVESILKTGLDQQPVPPAPPEQVVLFHDHIRGPEYYEKGES